MKQMAPKRVYHQPNDLLQGASFAAIYTDMKHDESYGGNLMFLPLITSLIHCRRGLKSFGQKISEAEM